jgi:hypothetical protein
VERLPNPVNAVKHSVMKPKRGIIDGRVEISRVAAHGVMTRRVQTEEAIWVSTLDFDPEIAVGSRTRANSYVQKVRSGKPLLGYIRTDVSAQAPRIVVGGVGCQVSKALHARRNWANVRLRTGGMLVL